MRPVELLECPETPPPAAIHERHVRGTAGRRRWVWRPGLCQLRRRHWALALPGRMAFLIRTKDLTDLGPIRFARRRGRRPWWPLRRGRPGPAFRAEIPD